LVNALLDDFPFEENERSWVSGDVLADFDLPGRRDLLYLVLCTLTKNALLALRGRPQPRLRIELQCEGATHVRPARRSICFSDNGPGIPPQVLDRLTHEPVTTRAESGGNGMGLMFCRRVMQSMGGSIEIESELGEGTAVTLYFAPA
jgi:two-component system, response regulator PhcR